MFNLTLKIRDVPLEELSIPECDGTAGIKINAVLRPIRAKTNIRRSVLRTSE